MLLLFDIDGTLTVGGPAKVAFRIALEATFGTAGPIASHDFSGKTDCLSVRELLTAAGRGPDEIEAGLPRLWEVYLSELDSRIGAEPVGVLPGASELIDALAERDDVYLGLVTGNVEGGAMMKLRSAGMWDYFPVGGYGSDHEARNELPPVAIRRAAAHWGRAFQGEDAVIIGDTPRDVECGKAVGAMTVAVATGRFSMAELWSAGADRVLADFSDTRTTIEALTPVRRFALP